ncbi:BON domain-containing protein [Sinosporangium album]|uniref:BON domain-containing protein n=1 Tax=Sinosporangium album TaxID=504805 RepID=A0A1G8EWM3_9ACTN|nr:CBS domain-containing protein [Sinosporangium album]SDH74207.1 BON domain-containing protein [Sinosporangium album]
MRITVQDVMTTDVVAVEEKATFHAVAELLIENGLSGAPVLSDDGRVVGVVSEADLLRKEEFKQRYYGDDYQPPLRSRLRHLAGSERGVYGKSLGESAGELMSRPPIVVLATAPVVGAARLMDRHGVKRLPVVDAEGRLVGIVSRRDLLKVFVRDDEAIRLNVREGLPPSAVDKIEIGVEDGVVTLSGRTDTSSEALGAIWHARNVDGVVALRDDLTWKDDDAPANLTMRGGAFT